jgi:hypothetical protein
MLKVELRQATSLAFSIFVTTSLETTRTGLWAALRIGYGNGFRHHGRLSGAVPGRWVCRVAGYDVLQ